MSGERTTVGLDVHARSVAAEAVDWSTGQVFRDTLVPDHDVVLAWLARLPGRDLVRAREAARADLMRARHRLSKLLLRHGIVYSGGTPWTGEHERASRRGRFAPGR
jgi:hypothetical protein